MWTHLNDELLHRIKHAPVRDGLSIRTIRREMATLSKVSSPALPPLAFRLIAASANQYTCARRAQTPRRAANELLDAFLEGEIAKKAARASAGQ